MEDKRHDDYPPHWPKGEWPAKEKTSLIVDNRTGVDLWIKVTCDSRTEEFYEPGRLNNNDPENLESRAIEFGNKANYCFEVWKNDNTEPGTFIGKFTHGVRWNAGGRMDLIEFVLVGDYFRVISIKQVGGKIFETAWPSK